MKEATWLPRLAPHLPLAVPVQLARGRPGDGYPYAWSVYAWLPGENANGTIDDLELAAVDLAGFVQALRRIDTTDAHSRRPSSRGAPLAELDEDVRRAIAELGDRIDAGAALRVWEESLAAPAWDGDEVWVHGDLLPGNLLVVGGRLSAVIDFGCLNVGDPACDLQPAWNVFAGSSRERYREELDVDEASWLRGRGWALYQAVLALPYYWDTNPGMIRQASNALDRCSRTGLTDADGEEICNRSRMPTDQYHEPPEELSEETRTFARVITSLRRRRRRSAGTSSGCRSSRTSRRADHGACAARGVPPLRDGPRVPRPPQGEMAGRSTEDPLQGRDIVELAEQAEDAVED